MTTRLLQDAVRHFAMTTRYSREHVEGVLTPIAEVHGAAFDEWVARSWDDFELFQMVARALPVDRPPRTRVGREVCAQAHALVESRRWSR